MIDVRINREVQLSKGLSVVLRWVLLPMAVVTGMSALYRISPGWVLYLSALIQNLSSVVVAFILLLFFVLVAVLLLCAIAWARNLLRDLRDGDYVR